ncbi:MAG: hypothetical protein AVDCRST_MAG91-866, partial [uncultured Sphingomonadaceae bacterium]
APACTYRCQIDDAPSEKNKEEPRSNAEVGSRHSGRLSRPRRGGSRARRADGYAEQTTPTGDQRSELDEPRAVDRAGGSQLPSATCRRQGRV